MSRRVAAALDALRNYRSAPAAPLWRRFGGSTHSAAVWIWRRPAPLPAAVPLAAGRPPLPLRWVRQPASVALLTVAAVDAWMRWIFPRRTLPPPADTPPRHCGHTFPAVNTPIHTVHKHALKFPLKLFPIPGTHKGIHSQFTFVRHFTPSNNASLHTYSISSKTPHVPLSPTPQRHLFLVPSLSVLLPCLHLIIRSA